MSDQRSVFVCAHGRDRRKGSRRKRYPFQSFQRFERREAVERLERLELLD
jgi:hypothetical protein